MRIRRISGLLLGLGLILAAMPLGSSPAADAFHQKDLVVHEWGVLSVFPDVETANADMREEWDALPKFVFGQVEGRIMPPSGVIMNARLPVIHLYSPNATDVNVRVDFPPTGKPLVWWPENVNTTPDYQNGRSKLRGNFLEWQVQIRSPQAANVQMMPLPSGHWMNALRNVKAEEMLVYGSGNRLATKEKFLYYDGTLPSPQSLDITGKKDKLTIKNKTDCTVADVTVVDRRTAGKVLVARIAALDAGAEKPLAFAEVDAKDWPDKGVQTLAAQLKGAGLFEDEAKVIADVWKKAFFETDGLTTFYRLPQSEYDRLLPLTVNPKPEKVVRVMLGHQPRCEPELAEQVQKLIEQLSAREFPQRVAAQKQLSAIGKAALPYLNRALKDASDPELKMRLTKLMEDYTIKLPAAK
jgi:hypothetical protein